MNKLSVTFLLFFAACLSAIGITTNIVDRSSINHIYFDVVKFEGADTLSVEQIAVLSDTLFFPIKNHKHNIEAGKPFWIRFEIKNLTQAQQLVLSFVSYYKIELYCIRNLQTKKWDYKANDLTFKLFQRPVLSNEIYIDIPYSSEKQLFYAKISPYFNMGFGITAYSYNEILKINTWNFLIYGLFIGAFGIIFIYSIISYLKLKERVYLFFGIYIFSNLIAYLSFWKFSYTYLGVLKLNFYLETIPYELIGITFILYSLALFKNYGIPQWIVYLIQIDIGLRIVLFMVSFLGSNPIFFNPLFDLLFVIPGFVLGIYFLLQKNRIAINYTLGCSVLVLGFAFHPISMLLPSLKEFMNEVQYFNPFGIFNMIEVVFFLFAITDRIQLLKKEKEDGHIQVLKYQDELLKESIEKNELKEKLNKELELLVNERTQQLSVANQHLMAMSEEINEMNKLLLVDNENLKKDVALLSEAKIMKGDVSFEEFKAVFKDESTCLAFVAQIKWVKGYSCSKCGYRKYYLLAENKSRKCKSCGHKESPLTHTLLENVKFPLDKALYIVFALQSLKNKKLNAIATTIDLRVATCYAFGNKILEELEARKTAKKEIKEWYEILTQ